MIAESTPLARITNYRQSCYDVQTIDHQLHMQHYYSNTSYTTRDVFRSTRAAGIFFGPQTTILLIRALGGSPLSFLIITRAEKWPDSSKDGMCRNDRFTSVSQLGWWEIYGGYQSTTVYMQLLMYIVPGWSFYIRRWSGCRHVLHKRNNNYYCSVLFTAHLCFSAQAMHIRGSGRRDGPVTGGMPCRPLQDLKTPPAEDACDV